jgi:hypothetical protein
MLTRKWKLPFTVGLLLVAQLSWATQTVFMGEHTAQAGGQLLVPVQMTDAAGVAAMTIIINYDASLLTLQEVTVGALAAGFTLEYNPEAGRVRMALVRGGTLAVGAGALVNLDFTVVAGALPGMSSPLAIADLTGWGEQGEMTAVSANGLVRIVSTTVNSPPVPGLFSLSTYRNTAKSFSAAKLARTAQDADGDVILLTAVSATSTNGGTVQLADGRVTYTPRSDYAGADAFTYTLSDGQGGLATGTVKVAVEVTSAISLNVVSGPLLTNGRFIVRFAGVPGATYTVEFTDSLAPANWLKVTNLTAPTTAGSFGRGVFEFGESAGAGLRLYRTVYPAY